MFYIVAAILYTYMCTLLGLIYIYIRWFDHFSWPSIEALQAYLWTLIEVLVQVQTDITVVQKDILIRCYRPANTRDYLDVQIKSCRVYYNFFLRDFIFKKKSKRANCTVDVCDTNCWAGFYTLLKAVCLKFAAAFTCKFLRFNSYVFFFFNNLDRPPLINPSLEA